MTTPYTLEKQRIDTFFGQPTAEELLNGTQGPKNSEQLEYSNDPDYNQVDPELFQYLLEGELE